MKKFVFLVLFVLIGSGFVYSNNSSIEYIDIEDYSNLKVLEISSISDFMKLVEENTISTVYRLSEKYLTSKVEIRYYLLINIKDIWYSINTGQASSIHEYIAVENKYKPWSISMDTIFPMLGVFYLDNRYRFLSRMEASLKIGVNMKDSTDSNWDGPFGYKLKFSGYLFAFGINYYLTNAFYIGLYGQYMRTFDVEVYNHEEFTVTTENIDSVSIYPLIGYKWNLDPIIVVVDFGYGYGKRYTPSSNNMSKWGWFAGFAQLGLGYRF